MNKPIIFNWNETRNAILGSLSDVEIERLTPHLRPVEMALGARLGHDGEVLGEVIFPESGMLSCILDSSQNVGVEVATVGREGVWNALFALNGTPSLNRTVVQAPGRGWSLGAEVLRDEFARGGALQKQVLRYLEMHFALAAVTGVCNRLHTVEERLARWLLIVRNGAESDEFDLESEFLACMLASRLSGVPLALGVMLQAGLIEVDGRRIRLLDVESLQRTACECHGILAERLRIYLDGHTSPAPVEAAPMESVALCGV